MGCTASGPELNPAEAALSGLEASLHFEAFTANQHFFILRRYSQSSAFLNSAAFEEAAKAMKIRTSNSLASPKTEEFYQSLRDPEVKARDLAVLAVLLAPGSDNEKAEILFEAYDNTYSKLLPRTSIQEMVQNLLEMSTNRIQILVEGLSQDKSKVLDYLSALRDQKMTTISMLVQAILGEKTQIAASEFVLAFEKADCQALLSSQKVRRLLYSRLAVKPV